ncbi:MAG: hypothetical protein R3221_10410, partial [Spongiibacter sp.]|nr:hypothetical protein [Spongiibacter sp.]
MTIPPINSPLATENNAESAWNHEKDNILLSLEQQFYTVIDKLVQGQLYSELGAIVSVYIVAWLLAGRVRKMLPLFRVEPLPPEQHPLKHLCYRCGKLLFPVFAIMMLRMLVEFSAWFSDDAWVMKGALIIAILLVFHSFVNIAIRNRLVATWFRWIATPVLMLHLVGVLDDVVTVLDSIAVEVGNIRISSYGVVRLIIFGSLLFWLGRVSSNTGQTIIRRQESLDIRTREVLAKLFEIGLSIVIILLLLQVMGINLT